MKKAIFALFAAAISVVCLFAFAGCAEGADDKTNDGTTTEGGDVTGGEDTGDWVEVFDDAIVFTASSELLQLSLSTTVKNYIDVLAERGLVTFEGYESAYGYFITQINGLAEQSTASGGYSWMLFTDFTDENGVIYADPAYGTYDYNGNTLASASYGVSYMPCVENYTYALVYMEWSY